MFGGSVPIPKEPKVYRKHHPTQDILNTCSIPGRFGHRAREPNTDQHVRMLHYNQRFEEIDNERCDKEHLRKGANMCMINFDMHAQRRVMRSEIKARVKVKMNLYEAGVQDRREKLMELFATEEREFVKITVENCQKGVQDKLEAMKERSRFLREKKARENDEFIEKKRLQQYMIRCMDLVPAMNEKNLRESKIIQLQQMRENEAKRESERELNKMWAHLQEKEANAKAEREKQELIIRYNKDKKDRDILQLQIEGKRLLKEEEKRVALEDRIELQKLEQKLKQEEIQAKEEVIKKRNKMCADLLKQIEIQNAFVAQRKEEEDALNNAFAKLSNDEYQKELGKLDSNSEVAKKETAQYKEHLKELASLRHEEQQKLDELLIQYQCEINNKMDKVQCELQEARKRLLHQTLQERGQQIEHKQQLAQKLLEMKQTENEWMTNIVDTNVRLLAETKRLAYMATKQYRHDLNQQIEYNNTLKERENIEMERQLQKGREEEMKYRAMVQHLIAQGHSAGSISHPFRKIVDKHECHCEPLMPKY